MTRRVSYARVRKWDEFHAGIPNDPPCLPVLAVVRAFLVQNVPIVFITGRPETYGDHTKRWLHEQYLWYSGTERTFLLMRPEGDYRPDTEVKPSLYDHFLRSHPGWHPLFAMEDRPQVVEMWRRRGITCFQVRDGAY